MPTLRFFRLCLLLAGFGLLGAHAQGRLPDKVVTSKKPLDSIAAELKSTARGSSLRIQFEEYANVGKFVSGDTILNRIDTLIFERSPKSMGTEFVSVQNTLLDIKDYAGTLVLRGLAFKLMTSGSILLTGYDFNRVNSHLIIDSCFIFGDTVSSAFLSWWAGPGSTVQIKRSFLVFQHGVNATSTSHKLLFNATNFQFMNNLFNFPGSMSAAVLSGGKFEMYSNSFNRTQVNLTSVAYQKAIYDFNLNYIGNPPDVDAHENSNVVSFLKATGFDTLSCLVRNTILYKSWASFDHAANNPREFDSTKSNVKREPTAGIPSTEFWNWYAPSSDANQGMGSGDGARSPRYNVFPSFTTPKRDTSKGTLFEHNEVTVFFKPGEFPRTFELTRAPVAVPDTFGPALRILSQDSGAVKFGPFEVTSIRLTTFSKLGRPVLVAVDTANRLFPQAPGVDTTPFQFANGFATARSFFFAFQGNTKRGNNVIPELPANQLGPNDSLVFSRVIASGMTSVKDTVREYPEFYRSLNRSLRILTSASVTGTVLVGSRGTVAPWDSGEVYWWGAQGSELHKPEKAANGNLQVRLPVADTIVVSLVEKLNVRKKGITEFPLPRGGRVVVHSENGFQLRIDSLTFKPDTTKYGLATRAYGMRFPGRGPTDTVTLYLPAGPDVALFKTKAANNDTIVPISGAKDEDGFFKVNMAAGDSGVKVFSGIPYNVWAGISFSDTLQELEVESLRSATSGLFSASHIDSTVWHPRAGAGVLPEPASLLGGRMFRMLNLTPDSSDADGFSVRFEYRAPIDPTQVSAFALERDGATWRPVSIVPGDTARKPSIAGLRVGDIAVIVLEALRPFIEYLDTTKVQTKENVTVSARYRPGIASAPYKKYMVEFHSVGVSGVPDGVRLFGPESIGVTIQVPLAGINGMYKYRVVFLDSVGIATPNAPFETPVSLWKPSSLVVDSASKERYRWHLVGFPYNTTLEATLDSVVEWDTTYQNTKRYFLLRSEADSSKAVWDSTTVKADPAGKAKNAFLAGDGLLFATATGYRYKVDDSADFLLPQPKVLNPEGKAGWRFVAVPFPMDFAISGISSTAKSTGPFLDLNMIPKMNGSVVERDYYWEQTSSDRLKPYKAYAYFFRPQETLTFDPWAASASAAPKASAAPPLSSVDVSLEAGALPRSMRLVSGPAARDVPFLPGPSGGLEMRVGGDGGYIWKRLDNLSAIDLPVRFDAPQAVSARLAFAHKGAASASGWRAVLVDLASGALIDPADQSLSLPSGSSEYRLVAGSESFVAERVSRFRAGLPADLALSQNAPNPFRGLTRITLDWPALSAGALSPGAGRRAFLEVFDARGKRMRKLDLGRVQAGRQSITLDASRWEPGVYTYRLTVVTGAGTSRLQKRMLVIR